MIQKKSKFFRENSKISIKNNARWLTMFLTFANTSWTELTFHSRMQMQI